MSTRRWLFRFAILGIGLLAVGLEPVLASTTTFQLPSLVGKAGGTVDVPIQAVGAPGLGAIHLELLYDPKVLTPGIVTGGSLTGGNALVDSNPKTAGRLIIGLATLTSIKGDGPIVVVRFQVVGAGGSSSALSLDNSKAWDSASHAEVLVSTQPGKLTVSSAESNLLWLILIAVLVVIGLLLFLFLVKKRRSPRAAA